MQTTIAMGILFRTNMRKLLAHSRYECVLFQSIFSIVELVHVDRVMFGPAIRRDAVHVDGASTVRIAVCRVEDGTLAQGDGLRNGEIFPVFTVEHTVSIRG